MMRWKFVRRFGDLAPNEVYNLLKLRQNVFLIEQNCLFEDIDDVDPKCSHLFLFPEEDRHENRVPAAYLRIVPGGIKSKAPSLGRIVVAPKYRGRGLGKKIVRKALDIVRSEGFHTIWIEAQAHLEPFYRDLGFMTEGDPYTVDGILHIGMTASIR